MAKDILGTYSPQEVVVILSVGDFVHTVNGYADGIFLNFARTTPASTLYSGADNSKETCKAF